MVIWLFFAALVSEIGGTIAGFGSSTIFLPLALLFVDFNTALTLTAFLHMFGTVGRVGFFRKGINKEMLFKFGVPSVLFSILGALLVSSVSQNLLKGMLGIFLICYSILYLWKGYLKIRSTIWSMTLGGAISGFIFGLIGTGGVLQGAFLTGLGMSKNSYIATAAMISMVVDITRLPIYLSQGFLDKEYYWYVPVLFVMAVMGAYFGKLIIKKIPEEKFTKLVLIGILLVGLKFANDLL